ncbi:META domain-containing protein [Streptomyces sp. Act143]|uniref:META domain-containing protein n=1 Tax=Streptomyces sp. Act143 TaxID=2200760 RepID=UPI000D6731CA|nr:META domain-containing protein [Streptomyces sp. Act143]PWI16531.1 META domain-containing protein [Streptomyces sp. Act143]
MDTQRMTLAVLTVLPLAAACGTEQADGGAVSAEPPVTGVHWSVDSVTVDGTTHRAPTGANVTIEDGRAAGNYGCNHFTAKVTFEDDALRLSDTTTTEMACEKRPMAFEETLARTLADGALKTDVTGDRLTLTTDTGDTVRLAKEPDAPLYGTKWGITAPGPTGDAHLSFDKKTGKVTGSLGCNRVTATATVSDGHITLGAPATTRMVCDTSLMKTEKSLLGLFDSTVKYKLDHRSLSLTSENGKTAKAVAVG